MPSSALANQLTIAKCLPLLHWLTSLVKPRYFLALLPNLFSCSPVHLPHLASNLIQLRYRLVLPSVLVISVRNTCFFVEHLIHLFNLLLEALFQCLQRYMYLYSCYMWCFFCVIYCAALASCKLYKNS